MGVCVSYLSQIQPRRFEALTNTIITGQPVAEFDLQNFEFQSHVNVEKKAFEQNRLVFKLFKELNVPLTSDLQDIMKRNKMFINDIREHDKVKLGAKDLLKTYKHVEFMKIKNKGVRKFVDSGLKAMKRAQTIQDDNAETRDKLDDLDDENKLLMDEIMSSSSRNNRNDDDMLDEFEESDDLNLFFNLETTEEKSERINKMRTAHRREQPVQEIEEGVEEEIEEKGQHPPANQKMSQHIPMKRVAEQAMMAS